MADSSADGDHSYIRQPWHEAPHDFTCYCGKRADMRTAWKGEHPGRRFFSCGRQICKFFKWYDPPMCERAKIIIPGLLKKINKLEEDAKKMQLMVKKAEEKLKKASTMLAVVMFALLVLLLIYVFM